MTKKNLENICGLTPMQQGFLFHSVSHRHADLYFKQSVFAIDGRLDVEAFQRACQAAVDHEPTLRTSFMWEAVEGPLQVVYRRARLPFEEHDLRALGPEEQEDAVRRITDGDRELGFDLSRPPLIRLKLLRLADDAWRLVWSVHHLVLDGWSTPLLFKEILAYYHGYAGGRAVELPPARPFSEYVAWLERRDASGDERFWRGMMEGLSTATPFRVDHGAARSVEGGFLDYEEKQLRLTEEASAALQAFGRHHQLTLNTLLQGAWAILLHRYSGEDTVCFGTVVSGRSAPVRGIETMLGAFINTLPLRVEVPDDGPVLELLHAIQDRHAAMREHEHTPLPDVQGWSGVPLGQPLFESVIVFENFPAVDRSSVPKGLGVGVRMARNDIRSSSAITLLCAPHARVSLRIAFDRRRFDADAVDRMFGHLSTLLAGIAEGAGPRVRDVPMLPEEERRRIVSAWNDAPAPAGEAATFHRLFEEQAAARPDAPAVAHEGRALPYGALNRLANGLAHRLRALGVGRGTLVGIAMPPSLELVVALLGVLKAGGAYVPIDLGLPRARVEQILDDTGTTVVLTLAGSAHALPAGRARALVLDGEDAPAEREDGPAPQAMPGDLAYVLFTSGSTGRPKGVAVEHRQLVSYVRAIAPRLALGAGASYALVSTFSADLGNTVVFPSLAGGGCLHVIASERVTDPDAIATYFRREGIDCLKIVPSHLSALLSGARPADVLPRRVLVLGGEASSWELIERINTLSPGTTVLNHYGPTETTVGVLTHLVDRARRDPRAGIVPLGRPLGGVAVYLLGPDGAPVPVGVPGEVFVGGAQVTRGYLNRPGLTAERFLPDPFGAPGARLYRTGDRARWLPDGSVLFLGRVDHQVKVRGYRVELGEIEVALEQHPAVRDAVVLAIDDGPTKRLAAFVLADAGATTAEILAFLASLLPGHMIPGSITALPAWPLLPNGKVDRGALAALAQGEDRAEAADDAPRDPAEEVIEAIWADVFGREHVGIHERFDELGGHSLLAIQLIARVRDAFQVEVPLRAVFEAPTIAELAERVEALRREGGAPAIPAIEPAPRGEPLPLSFAQERLWFIDRLEPDSALYNVPSARRLLGPLDASVLERALREVVRRHEVLRTTFALADGRPVQVIHDEVDLRLPVEDLGGLPEAEREAEVAALVSAEARRPFDLERGPVLRLRLLRLGPEEHVLVSVLHHIVSDAWTQGVLHDEVARLYAAFRAGEASPLPPLPLQYADYAVWQRRWLSGEVLDGQIAWWKAHLAGAPAAIELPTDRPRPAVMSFKGGRQPFALAPEPSRAIVALGRREGATLFMVLLAALDVLLARWSGQRDVVVGVPIAGRTRAQTQGLIGFFVNTLALRTRLDDDPSFTDLLTRVRETCLGAYANQDLPFERLVDELNPARDLSRTPLFQVMLVLLNPQRERRHEDAITRRGLAADSGTSKFDLTFALGETPRGITGNLEYAADLFDAATITRMLGHLRVLLESIAEGPERPVSALPMLPGEEQARLLAQGQASAAFPVVASLHGLFEAQADRTPEAPAVSAEDGGLSYRDLDRRANQVAHALRRRGVGRGTLVGLCMDRSLDLVVGLLGILKAGGAYVPLDPSYPHERLAFMIEDAGAAVVVTHRDHAALVAGASLLQLDADAASIAAEPESRPEAGAGPDDLAYVLYTSGSTGRPKGAMVTHRNVARLFSATQAWYGFGAEDVWTVFHSYAFDFSVWELWGALLHGGRAVVVPFWVSRSPDAFLDLLAKERVTVLDQTPSAFRALVHAETSLGEVERRALALRWVIFGGEALDVGDLAPWWERHGDEIPKLVNMYGITETTVHVTFRPMTRADLERPWSSVIGRPIPDLSVHVLDAALELAPIGVPGELCVGGAGVALGYLKRPELTAERFVPDPFAHHPGARLYRSGDLARWSATGDLVYLGRIDQQVKIRGFRIEIGEIEAALGASSGVRAAVVVAREDAPGARRLVAYVVPGGAGAPDVEALRASLKERLPEYMIPSAFVFLDELPRTENGKVDRKRLPAPEPAAPLDHTEPRTVVEETLCRVWAEVLRLPRVGVHDNFFSVGGDSIISIQIVTRARAAGITLTPRMFFLHQTIAELATVAVVAGDAPVEEEGPATGPVPLTPIQRWWLEDDPVDAHHFNQSVLLESRDPVSPAALLDAVRAVLAHHDALRLRVSRGEGGWEQQIVPFDDVVPFEHVDLGGLPEGDRSAAVTGAAERAQASLDLGAGPLIRVVLFTSSGGADRLLVVVHHFAVDGVSWRILLDDLWKAYEARRRGEAPALPPRTTSIQRWSQRLTEHARSEALEDERAYWLSAPRRRVRRLPVDHPAGENTEEALRRANVSLSAEETEALLRVVPEAYRTQINDVLLTAMAQALCAWTGADAALVALEGHGREEIFADLDLTRTVGWFTVLYPMVLALPAGGGLGEALMSVKEQLRAVPNHGIGYGLLRYLRGDEELRSELSQLPQAEVSFNYLGQLDQALPEDSPLSRARENAGPTRSPRGRRRHAIDVLTSVAGGRLNARFAYAGSVHDAATIERLADRFIEALRALIAHCTSPEAGGTTPSDLLEPGITDDMLDFMASLDPTAPEGE